MDPGAAEPQPDAAPRDADATRAQARAALDACAAHAGSARSLWSAGYGADALRLCVDALPDATAALERLAPGALGPLDTHGVSRRAEEAARVRDAIAAANVATLPDAGTEVDDAHAALFERTVTALGIVEQRLRDAARTPGERRRAIGARVVLGVAVVAAIAAALVHAHQPVRAGAYARASATWGGSPNYAQELVADGDKDTAWLLPDNATGWTDVRFTPPITVHHVRLFNAWNPPPADRGTKDFTVELYVGPRLVRSIAGTFPDVRPPSWQVLAVDARGIRGVTRIRFVVRSSYRMGAGLAELDWD